MIRFTTLLAAGTPTPEAFATYARRVGPDDAATALALLSGTRPKRIATADLLLAWVAARTQTADVLIQSCLTVTPDKLEVASLLLPPATATPPTLTDVLTHLTPASYLDLALRLPPQARLILNRLATGTFRTKLPISTEAPQNPGTCRAFLTMLDPSGPTATFALPHGNGLIPLCKLPLTLPETHTILAWAKTNTTNRFGPLREVSPTLLFELSFAGLIPNTRRKCGFALSQGQVIRWLPNATHDMASRLPLDQTGPATYNYFEVLLVRP